MRNSKKLNKSYIYIVTYSIKEYFTLLLNINPCTRRVNEIVSSTRSISNKDIRLKDEGIEKVNIYSARKLPFTYIYIYCISGTDLLATFFCRKNIGEMFL